RLLDRRGNRPAREMTVAARSLRRGRGTEPGLQAGLRLLFFRRSSWAQTVCEALPVAYNSPFDTHIPAPKRRGAWPVVGAAWHKERSMVNEKVEGREMTWRTLFPWTELFRGFQVALDLNKLLLAAAGIVVMAFGWWVLAWGFGSAYATQPNWPEQYITKAPNGDVQKGWEQFKHDREQWNLMHKTAGVGPAADSYDALDLASSLDEYNRVQPALEKAGPTRDDKVRAIEQLGRE